VARNEKSVLPETLAACDALTYPNKVLIIADDSDDPDILQSLRELAVPRGCRQSRLPSEFAGGIGSTPPNSVEIRESPDFVFHHRQSNAGFKGGNLRAISSYLRNRGINLMYLLDADWHPQADCIDRTMELLRPIGRLRLSRRNVLA
jgi:GT2 family glycosyltransferase